MNVIPQQALSRATSAAHTAHIGRVAAAMSKLGLGASILLDDAGEITDTLRIRFPFSPGTTDVIVPPPGGGS